MFPDVGTGTWCALFGFSRQAYYKHTDRSDFAVQCIREMILQSVRSIREKMPRIGSRKLFLMIQKELGNEPAFPGRDKFLEILASGGLLLKVRRRKRYKTTDSNHPYQRYPNLIRGRVFDAPDQAWASDITYVETAEGVCYLSLITDLYSRKIVGWALGPTLEAIYCMKALQMALDSLPASQIAAGLIHHSDRGCQYCCHDYVGLLKSRGIQISMTENGDPLENAVAERVNGILKNEWLCVREIKTRAECLIRIEQAVESYNNARPHMSLGYQTPAAVHGQSGLQKRCWKTFAERKAQETSVPACS